MPTRKTKATQYLALLTPYLKDGFASFPEEHIHHRPGLTPEERKTREAYALHEAAHFVAACACRGSTLNQVFITPTGRTTRQFMGRMLSGENSDEDALFVTMAGIEWERLIIGGRMERAKHDQEDADLMPCSDREAIADKASDFLYENYNLVVGVALAFMALCRKKDGQMGKARLKDVANWTRGHVVTPGELQN